MKLKIILTNFCPGVCWAELTPPLPVEMYLNYYILRLNTLALEQFYFSGLLAKDIAVENLPTWLNQVLNLRRENDASTWDDVKRIWDFMESLCNVESMEFSIETAEVWICYVFHALTLLSLIKLLNASYNIVASGLWLCATCDCYVVMQILCYGSIDDLPVFNNLTFLTFGGCIRSCYYVACSTTLALSGSKGTNTCLWIDIPR